MHPVVKVSRRPIRPDTMLSYVRAPSAGGIASFIGTVRDRSDGRRISGMELEAAVSLARTDLVRISMEAARKFAVSKMSVAHRIGRLRVGDIIVMIAVSAPHRADAFKACQYVIDELKKTTPIWKKEFSGRTGRWVKGDD